MDKKEQKTGENGTDQNIWGYFVQLIWTFLHQAGLLVIPKNDQNETLPDSPKCKQTLCPF